MKKLIVFFLALFAGQTGFAQTNTASILSGQASETNVSKGQSNQELEDQKISQLISYIRNMTDAVFIRNGEEFTSGKAADHLQSKWDKHKKKIKTAQDFIEKLATQSKTDELYQIKFHNGTTITCADYLKKELARMESHATAPSGKSSK